MRTSDARLTAFLGQARKACVSDAILYQFFDGLIVSDRLQAESLAQVWSEWPDAMVLTATLQSAGFVNSMGFEWHNGDYLGEVQVWMGEGQYGYLKLKRGMKVDVTYNLDIDSGLFNGTAGKVRGIHGCGVEIETANGVDMIWRRYGKVFNESTGRSVRRGCFDLRAGYAMTVHKAEGATLDRAIVVLENWSCAGWGYTAMSRVREREHLRIIGEPSSRHFHPRV